MTGGVDMLVHDLITLAECVAEFIAMASIVNAWRHRTPRHLRPRRCPQCRGHLSRWCRTCNGSGRIPPRGRTRPHGHA